MATQAPGTVRTSWLGSTGVSTTLPITVKVVLTDDLPNGPYGEIGITGTGKIFVPVSCTYNDVANATLAAFIKSRGSMMKVETSQWGSVGTGLYSEEWRIVNIEFKGGAADPAQQASAGSHVVTMGLLQKAGLGPCCTIL